jgi:pimeloyl-ACP methyl ester carboxylesterase
MEDLTNFCSNGSTYEDCYVDVAAGVSLRVITFHPANEVGNPIVLFVAGWITQMSAWQSVLKEMTKDFRVVYIETREKISSRINRSDDFGVEAIGDDLVKLAGQLGLAEKRFVIFGSSLGATAVIDCYPKLKNKPAALILIGPNAEFRVPLTWKVIVTAFYPPLYNFIKPLVKWYLKTFRLNVGTDIEQYKKYSTALDAADPWKLKKAVLALAHYEVWDKLGALDVPTLLVGASEDALHEPDNLRMMADRIPTVVTIDLGTNKITHSERVVDETRKFISRLSAGSGKN